MAPPASDRVAARRVRTVGFGEGSGATGGAAGSSFGFGAFVSTLIGFGSGGWATLLGAVAIGLCTGGGAGGVLVPGFEPVALSLSTLVGSGSKE